MYVFDEDTVAVARQATGQWEVGLTDRWNIGPNPNGGYVLAAITAAMFEASDKPHPLSLTAHYLRPASAGAATVEVETIRSGKRHSHLHARLVQGTERVRVLAVFGDLDAAEGLTLVREEPPDLPPPDECVGRLPGLSAGPAIGAPTIMERFETRISPTCGWIRGEPTGVPEITGWIRFADGRPPDVRSLPLFADGFPPPVFELGPAGWVPTIELTVHVRARPAPGWLRARFATHVLIDGYLSEDGEIWDANGTLVAQSRQLAMLLPVGGG